MTAEASAAPWRQRLQARLEDPRFERFIVAVIIVNAVVLGLETSATAMTVAGRLLVLLDQAALAIFTVEIALKLTAQGWRFFLRGWNLFDFTIVAISLLPLSPAFSVLRALRILRALRLMSMIPQMRKVVAALISAIPGMGSVVALLGLIFYVFAVIATKLFAESFPEWFGTLPRSLFTLFQIMTLESWSMGIVRPVMEAYPLSWLYFVPFILVTTFAVLNLFIAIIVNAMQAGHEAEMRQHERDFAALLDEIREIRGELQRLAAERRHDPPPVAETRSREEG